MRSWMIGIALGILPVGLLPVLPPPYLSVVIACTGAALLLGRSPVGFLMSGGCVGFAFALWQGHQLLASRLSDECTARNVSVIGTVANLPRQGFMFDGTRRQRFELEVGDLSPPACRGPRRILLSYYGDKEIIPGQRWQFGARLKKPWGLSNPGSFNMQAWYTQTGIDAVGNVRTGRAQLVDSGEGAAYTIDRLRRAISSHIAALPLEPEVAAILRALTVADRSGIDTGLWQRFQRYGLNHLLVISGLHIGLVAGSCLLLAGLPRRLLAINGITVAWLGPVFSLVCATGYTALAGFSLSTQRALCMLTCFTLAHLCARASSSAHNLLLAASAVLLFSPFAALGSGFWLSFLSVAALLWFGHWCRPSFLPYKIAGVHLYMCLLMLPLGGWWFGGSSVLAAPANMVMVPLVGLVVVPLALLGVVCFIPGAPGADFLWTLAGWPIELALSGEQLLEDMASTWGYWHHQPDGVQIGLGLLAILVCVLPQRKVGVALSAVLLAPLVLPVLSEWNLTAVPSRATPSEATRSRAAPSRAAPSNEHSLYVTALDVGQGTAVLVRSGERALLYDSGGGDPGGGNMASWVILPYLRKTGIDRLDTLIISHADRDHSAGTTTILSNLEVARFRLGAPVPGVEGGLPCRAGEAWRWSENLQFQFLSPSLEQGLPSNDSSCVLKIRFYDDTLLLPGDIEGDRERQLVRYWQGALNSDWLLVGHHGSRTSSINAWLKTIDPDSAIVSSGYANRFGHPHPTVVGRLQQHEIRIHQTFDSGALEFEFRPGREPVVRAHRQLVQRFWM